MAHQLQIDTVAKGVETEGQAHFLRRSRCDIAQGFLFGAPMQASHLAALLCTGEQPLDALASSTAHAPQFFAFASIDDSYDFCKG